MEILGVSLTGNDSALLATESSPSTSASSTSSGSATTSTSSTPSATETFVTSGKTGIADYRCNDTDVVTVSETPYKQECNVYYPTNKNRVSPSPMIWLKNIRDSVTAYSFEECIEACESYNESKDAEDSECFAVSFFFLLETSVSFSRMKWKGNCFLKNGRGERAVNDAGYIHLGASAFKECLISGSCD